MLCCCFFVVTLISETDSRDSLFILFVHVRRMEVGNAPGRSKGHSGVEVQGEEEGEEED
jgi:hypothetical protein